MKERGFATLAAASFSPKAQRALWDAGAEHQRVLRDLAEQKRAFHDLVK